MTTINCYHCLSHGDEAPIDIDSCSNSDGKINLVFRCTYCASKWSLSLELAQIKAPTGVLRSGDLILGGLQRQ